jgi:hypothetical protein
MTGLRGASAGLGQQTVLPRARPRKRGPKLSRGIDLRGEYRGGAPRGERARSANEWQHSLAWRAPVTAFTLRKENREGKVREVDGRAFRRSAFPSLSCLHDRVRRMPDHVVPWKICSCACETLRRDALRERSLTPSLRAQRSNPAPMQAAPGLLRRFAPRNDGFGSSLRPALQHGPPGQARW